MYTNLPHKIFFSLLGIFLHIYKEQWFEVQLFALAIGPAPIIAAAGSVVACLGCILKCSLSSVVGIIHKLSWPTQTIWRMKHRFLGKVLAPRHDLSLLDMLLEQHTLKEFSLHKRSLQRAASWHSLLTSVLIFILHVINNYDIPLSDMHIVEIVLGSCQGYMWQFLWCNSKVREWITYSASSFSAMSNKCWHSITTS